MAKKRFVITSGKGISMILYRKDFFKIKNAERYGKILQRKGKKNVCIKSFRRGEGLSHIKCLKN